MFYVEANNNRLKRHSYTMMTKMYRKIAFSSDLSKQQTCQRNMKIRKLQVQLIFWQMTFCNEESEISTLIFRL